ncbi:MAG: CrcB family protein [Nostocoides sp.]
MTTLLVALGAALGAPSRYLVMHALRTHLRTTAVAGTITVNVIGSLILGWAVSTGLHGSALGLVGTGFCGALTTFSTWGLELWEAWVDGERRHALANLVLSLTLGIGAAWLGWALAR